MTVSDHASSLVRQSSAQESPGFSHGEWSTALVGLEGSRETVEQTSKRDGLEIDLVTHEVRKFFLLMLKKNGCETRTYRPTSRLVENHTGPSCSPWRVLVRRMARR
jgi:hypothetical protein